MPGTVPTKVSWTFLYLMVGLKIPIAALLYLVWWAIHQVPETEPGASDDGQRKPRHPRPPLPRRPRRPRGAHGLPVPAPPQRMRVVPARSLATARAERHRVTR